MKALLIAAIISTLLAVGIEYNVIHPHIIDYDALYCASTIVAIMCWLGVWIRLVFFHKK